MRVLVIDDEKNLVKGIKFNLEHEGYAVDAAFDGETGLKLASDNPYDLIILDLMMPKIDGLEACRRIREFSSVPVIMLTARGESTDKLLGFDMGADDYLTKPFDILELKARIRAIVRRAGSSRGHDSRDSVLEIGHIRLDSMRRLVFKNGTAIELTAKEFDLLALLMRHPGRVYSRENLLDTVWGYTSPGDIRTVDVHIRRLREKIELDPASPSCIMTKWSVGYYFRG
jgi:DNA-binding response OmpR family regulator